jgi:hypothetical protein
MEILSHIAETTNCEHLDVTYILSDMSLRFPTGNK